jgi:hypothetical protein
MKSTTYRTNVGIVGFFEQQTAHRLDHTRGRSDASHSDVGLYRHHADIAANRADAPLGQQNSVAVECLESQSAKEGLVLLRRLRGYTLPDGKMSVVRELARRISGIADPVELRARLTAFERELIIIGGVYDPALSEAIESARRVFPGAHLIEIRNPTEED